MVDWEIGRFWEIVCKIPYLASEHLLVHAHPTADLLLVRSEEVSRMGYAL